MFKRISKIPNLKTVKKYLFAKPLFFAPFIHSFEALGAAVVFGSLYSSFWAGVTALWAILLSCSIRPLCYLFHTALSLFWGGIVFHLSTKFFYEQTQIGEALTTTVSLCVAALLSIFMTRERILRINGASPSLSSQQHQNRSISEQDVLTIISLEKERRRLNKDPAWLEQRCIGLGLNKSYYYLLELGTLNRLETKINDSQNSENKLAPEFDPYKELGLQLGATKSEIKKAYRRLLREYHPDKVDHLGSELQALAKEKTINIKRAYEMLSKK